MAAQSGGSVKVAVHSLKAALEAIAIAARSSRSVNTWYSSSAPRAADRDPGAARGGHHVHRQGREGTAGTAPGPAGGSARGKVRGAQAAAAVRAQTRTRPDCGADQER